MLASGNAEAAAVAAARSRVPHVGRDQDQVLPRKYDGVLEMHQKASRAVTMKLSSPPNLPHKPTRPRSLARRRSRLGCADRHERHASRSSLRPRLAFVAAAAVPL